MVQLIFKYAHASPKILRLLLLRRTKAVKALAIFPRLFLRRTATAVITAKNFGLVCKDWRLSDK